MILSRITREAPRLTEVLAGSGVLVVWSMTESDALTGIDPDELAIAVKVLRQLHHLPAEHPDVTTVKHAASHMYKALKQMRRLRKREAEAAAEAARAARPKVPTQAELKAARDASYAARNLLHSTELGVVFSELAANAVDASPKPSSEVVARAWHDGDDVVLEIVVRQVRARRVDDGGARSTVDRLLPVFDAARVNPCASASAVPWTTARRPG